MQENKKYSLSSLYIQMLIIIITFTVMSLTSYLIARAIEKAHMKNDAENALTIVSDEIISSFSEYETFLTSYSETLKLMIEYGVDEYLMAAYMEAITGFTLNDPEHIGIFNGTQAYFTIWDGKYISGNGWTPSDDFFPMDHSWYKTAVESGGRIAVSNPYINPVPGSITGDTLVSLSRCIYHDNGALLGVVCIDLTIDKIIQAVYTVNLTKGSYGVLLNNKLEVIAFPYPFYLNLNLHEINSGLANIANELELTNRVDGRTVRNYRGVNSIVYFRKIKYDLFLGIVIPIKEYNKNITILAFVLVGLGAALASVLCMMMYQISKAKMKSDIRTQQKSNFLATMSHEIRTPLNAILGMTEIQMQNPAHPPATSEAFLKINNSGNFLLGIINDILDLSKIESGKIELIPVKYEVASLINDIVQLNYIRYESRPIEFILEVDENIPSILVGDELRIKQILNNLLSNAFKYTDSGEVLLSINAEVVGRAGAALVSLIFNIRDTGQGMNQEQIKKLFDEYSRFNMEANRTTVGTGLGMTITRNLIELMYGNISVKSTVGEGTHVTVRLPQKTDGPGIRGFIGREMAENLRHFKKGNATYQKKSQILREYMPYGSVLIVDDVETNLYVAKGLMTSYGLRIDLAESGFEAIEKIKKGNIYDVIFMDHMMPKMDGIETTRQLREMNYLHPIVALTANALAGQAEIFQNSGFDGFIAKPIDVRHLNIALNTLIRDKQTTEVLDAAQKEKEENEKRLASFNIPLQVDSQLAEIFAKDARKSAVILKNCVKANLRNESDLQLYIINIHAMKSALANVGKHELSAYALRLEEAGREKDINVLLSETEDFLEKLNETITEIKPKAEETEEQADTEETLSFLKEKLTVIKEACDNFDKKTVKNTLNELREKTWSSNKKDLINSLSEHILHSEFESASALANEEINKL